MPLKQSPSKEAFRANVEKELEAGRPKRQALAIAYRIKRDAEKKKAPPSGKSGRSCHRMSFQRKTK